MAKFSDYPEATSITKDDVTIIDGGEKGTRSILALFGEYDEWDEYIRETNDPRIAVGIKRALFRGKNLGSQVTSKQYASIESGLFLGLFLGDYWTIGGVNYRIADFDYHYRTGDVDCLTHHLTIVPDGILYDNIPVNTSNTTSGAYVNSKMYTTNLASAKTTINAAFPNHVLSHRAYLQNATTSGSNANCGYPTAGAWLDSTVELMNESMVYGTDILRARGTGQLFVNNVTVEHHQLALFKENPRFITIRETYWLRDIVTSAHFAIVGVNGDADYYGASDSLSVRPYFDLCA